jgi:uncharacterized alpha-E superfamily protein
MSKPKVAKTKEEAERLLNSDEADSLRKDWVMQMLDLPLFHEDMPTRFAMQFTMVSDALAYLLTTIDSQDAAHRRSMALDLLNSALDRSDDLAETVARATLQDILEDVVQTIRETHDAQHQSEAKAHNGSSGPQPRVRH